jgi:hypothetical protein
MDPKPKQYLILVDELHKAILGKLCPGLAYVEVTGMPITGNNDYQVLVSPVQAPEDHIADVNKMVEGTPTEGVTEETSEV